MNITFLPMESSKQWNDLIVQNPDGGNCFSSSEIAEIKTSVGWEPHYIMAENTAILALERSIPLLGKFWYLPKGPGVSSVSALQKLLPDLKRFASQNGVFAVKIEPELLKTGETTTKLRECGLEKTFAVQPNSSTVIVDISGDEDAVLASLNQKGRHAIRRAERDGVTVKPVELTDENIDTMYELLRVTAEGKWNLRAKTYFTQFWRAFAKNGYGQLFFAYSNGEIVSGAFAILLGKKGTYKDGASVRERNVYGASHLLQWEIIKWMKARGVESYDLCGTPPSDAIRDPDHRFSGLARFKTSFNKHVTDYVGAYNLPIKPLQFWLWNTVVERLTLRLHARKKRGEWY